MLDWTDKHCRHLHRLITRHARLYTEMVTCGALLHGSLRRHLRRDEMERPVALQLGGSDPAELAQCARLGQQWGYDEINLNCGCPSPRVQRGAFGACLMTQPRLVADCVKAMRDAVHIPVTVKHRIGIDREESHAFVRDFVGEVAQAGCGVFIVHARNAWLEGLSPKENREVPPLRHERIWQLKRDFPQLTICLSLLLALYRRTIRLVGRPYPDSTQPIRLLLDGGRPLSFSVLPFVGRTIPLPRRRRRMGFLDRRPSYGLYEYKCPRPTGAP